MSAWGSLEADILPEFYARTLLISHFDGAYDVLRPDVAVLVSRREMHNHEQEWVASKAILHLSGFWSAFASPELAINFEQNGWSFHALDMRRQGRAARHANLITCNNVRDLRLYFEEINASVEYLRSLGAKKVVLHAQGGAGLVAALGAQSINNVDGLIISSPWLGQTYPYFKTKLAKLISLVGNKIYPKATVAYTPVSLLQEVCLLRLPDNIRKLMPQKPAPISAGFAWAIYQAQEKVAGGLRINIPVLLATARLSADSYTPPALDRYNTDCVLQVEDMLACAEKLGSQVQILRVDRGVHVLWASRLSARNYYYDHMNKWLSEHFG